LRSVMPSLHIPTSVANCRRTGLSMLFFLSVFSVPSVAKKTRQDFRAKLGPRY
jgi:hypothetical protein